MGSTKIFQVDLVFTTETALTQDMAKVLWERCSNLHTRRASGFEYAYSINVESVDPFAVLFAAGRILERDLGKCGIEKYVVTELAAKPFGVAALRMVPTDGRPSMGEQGG